MHLRRQHILGAGHDRGVGLDLRGPYERSNGLGLAVPSSVPRRGPRTISPQTTPTKVPIKNWPETIDFRPALESPLALANRRLRPLGHLTANAKCT
jgi:hypothetical protein